jgi:integrase
MASVCKRRGLYVVDYRDLDKRRRAKFFETRKEADDYLEDILKGLRQKTLPRPTKTPTFAEAAARWLETKEGKRTSSLAAWQTHVQKHLVPAIGKLRLDEISTESIELLRDRLRATSGLSAASVNKVLMTAAAIYNRAIKNHQAAINPVANAERLALSAPGADVPSETTRDAAIEVRLDDVLSLEEAQKLLAAATEGLNRAFLMTGLLTGARVGELTALTWPDVDFDEKTIRIRRAVSWAKPRGVKGPPRPQFYPPKTKKGVRDIPIPDELVAELRRWKLACPPTEHDLVFPSSTGTPAHRSTLRKFVLKPTVKRAKLRDVTIHSLRHTYASMLIDAGEPVSTVQARLGHSKADVTLRVYTHFFEKKRYPSDAISRLGAALTARRA